MIIVYHFVIVIMNVGPPGILDCPSSIDYCLRLMLTIYVSAYLLANNALQAHHACAHDGMLSSLSYID